jgi:hypothetical protein
MNPLNQVIANLTGWCRKAIPRVELREVVLPGNVGTVSIPANYTVELEDVDSTLVAFPVGEKIILRFSSLSFAPKRDVEDGGKSFVAETAAEKGHEYFEMGDKGIERYEEPYDHDGAPLIIKYWHIGLKNSLVIITATIEKACAADDDVKAALELMPRILESVTISVSHRVIVKDGKEIKTTTETVEPTPQSIRPFEAHESDWLLHSEDQARALSLKYGSGGELDPEELDRVFGRWMADDERSESADDVSEALGAAFGSFLVNEKGFKWVVVNDENGTAYATKHEIAETMAFPVESVRKRIERGEHGFFQDVYTMIVEHLAAAKKWN